MSEQKFPEYSIEQLIQIFSKRAQEFHKQYNEIPPDNPYLIEYFNLSSALLSFAKAIKKMEKHDK